MLTLRLADARSGRIESIRLRSRYGVSIVVADVSIRTLLTADLVRRVAALYGVSAGLVLTVLPDGLARTCSALNIPPADFAAPAREVDLVVVAGVQPSTWLPAGHQLLCGSAPSRLPDLPTLDPLAARLALLSSRYGDPVDLSRVVLDPAQEQVLRWRATVASCAEEPSRPMSLPHLARVLESFAADLDTPTAIETLDQLAGDRTVPPGAVFETFAHLDRLLGLDLVRDVGRPSAGGVGA